MTQMQKSSVCQASSQPSPPKFFFHTHKDAIWQNSRDYDFSFTERTMYIYRFKCSIKDLVTILVGMWNLTYSNCTFFVPFHMAASLNSPMQEIFTEQKHSYGGGNDQLSPFLNFLVTKKTRHFLTM